ncbi:hypothetical protein C8Q76DRAFT_616887, partial [Earliella scabrosa]
MHIPIVRLYHCFALITVVAEWAHSRSVNRTIDDQWGDSLSGALPQYDPPDRWQQGLHCRTCAISFDTSLVYRGTWHDSTAYDPDDDPIPHTLTVEFVGTAVYVYNVLANTVYGYSNDKPPPTILSIFLDNQPVGQFRHTPTDTTAFQFNELVYSTHGLSDTTHTLKLQAFNWSLVLFDYIVYT